MRVTKFGKNDFLKLLQEKDGEELLRLLRGLGGEWVVQSSPFGCPAAIASCRNCMVLAPQKSRIEVCYKSPALLF
jgi:hypothetical protein